MSYAMMDDRPKAARKLASNLANTAVAFVFFLFISGAVGPWRWRILGVFEAGQINWVSLAAALATTRAFGVVVATVFNPPFNPDRMPDWSVKIVERFVSLGSWYRVRRQIARGADIRYPHLVWLGKGVVVPPGCMILGPATIEGWVVLSGGTTIMPEAFVGRGAEFSGTCVVSNGAHIGRFVRVANSIIGEYAVVCRLSRIANRIVAPRSRVNDFADTDAADAPNRAHLN